MKFTVERDVLNDAVSWVAKSLSPRPPMPVLSGILIQGSQGLLTLSSFDYETSARLEIEADVTEEGTILVPGRLLADVVRSFPTSATVTAATEGSKLQLSCRSSRFALATMPEAEYPELPPLPAVSGSVDGAEFATAISQMTVAASKDDTLPILTAVRLEFEDDKITLLATDRYRLAMRELSWRPTTPGISTSALVKARTLDSVAKNLAHAGSLSIALENDADLIGFESSSRRQTSLLVDGDYPKIRSLFPESTPIHAVVSTSELVAAVNRVKVVAERNTPIRLAFTDGAVSLDAGTGEDAQASESISARLVGEEITVAFNPTYLSEGLGAISTDFVRFSFTSAPKPAMLTAQAELEGEDEDTYRYLVMPVRLPNQ
ncbi:DNA polymerase III subunit beta [Falsarthrobacter nasiphocae]|uniref:Beta sliding clamp n=1 Tax=Falsarthrobacter nasiphocae TaxID=189863 RepID=A0AAE4C6E6_9MICC|nr:DNA polymerase III subunit beta [Falsarthrobacter nasiphocae]MDR6892072.1 DNA polymerase-3 subunit beta [Falsarthrobacter nasiphocae]